MGQGLSSWNECILEGVVHEIVQGGGVEVRERGQPTTKVGRALLRAKYATKSKIVRLLQIFPT